MCLLAGAVVRRRDGSMIIILFWVSTLASMVLSATGVIAGSRSQLMVAAVCALPLSLYLAATPRFSWFGLLLPVPQVFAGWVINRSRPLALALAAIFPGFVVWLEATVLLGNSSAAI
jgi:hypothetical protein